MFSFLLLFAFNGFAKLAISDGFTLTPPTINLSKSKISRTFLPRTNERNLDGIDRLFHSQFSCESSTQLSSSIIDVTTTALTSMTRETAEELAGPFFGLSLFPYLGFLYLLNLPENNTPKGVTVGFATCLLFVFLTIPAAITAQLQYGVSLADSDWLHGSAESLLTITNLVTVIAFRQALNYKEKTIALKGEDQNIPQSVIEYQPMINLVLGLTAFAGVTALVPAAMGAQVHTPYLNGFMDFPVGFLGMSEPDNALTVAW